jgi:hypothetical protein
MAAYLSRYWTQVLPSSLVKKGAAGQTIQRSLRSC